MHNHRRQDCGRRGVRCRHLSCFEAVVQAPEVVRQPVVQVRLRPKLADSIEKSNEDEVSYSWMLIGKGVINGHVLEVWFDVLTIECLDDLKIEI